MVSNKFIIDVFCERVELSDLIFKTFNKKEYEIRYNPGIQHDDISLNQSDCDCLIIDKSIDKRLHEKIIELFADTPKIYLPWLDNENINGLNATYISEPFKLSELKKTVESLLLK